MDKNDILRSYVSFLKKELADPETDPLVLQAAVDTFINVLDSNQQQQWFKILSRIAKPHHVKNEAFCFAFNNFILSIENQLFISEKTQIVSNTIDPETLKRHVEKYQQHLTQIKQAQKLWKDKWKKVFEEQIRTQRLIALGLIASNEKLASVENVVGTAIDITRSVRTEVTTQKKKPPQDRVGSEKATQNIIERFKDREWYLGLPAESHPELVSLVRQVYEQIQESETHPIVAGIPKVVPVVPVAPEVVRIARPAPEIATVMPEEMARVAIKDKEQIVTSELDAEEIKEVDLKSQAAIRTQVYAQSTIIPALQQNEVTQPYALLLGQELEKLPQITEFTGGQLTAAAPNLSAWVCPLVATSALDLSEIRRVYPDLKLLKLELYQHLKLHGIDLPDSVLDQIFVQLYGPAPEITPPPPPIPPSGVPTTPVVPHVPPIIPSPPTQPEPFLSRFRLLNFLRQRWQAFIKKFPLALKLRRSLSPIFQGVSSLFRSIGVFGKPMAVGVVNVITPAVAGIGNNILPTAYSMINRGRTAVGGLGSLFAPVQAVGKTFLQKYGLVVLIIGCFLFIVGFVPMETPATKIVQTLQPPGEGEPPAEYVSEIVYEGSAPPAEILGCPVNEGYINQCPGGSYSHKNLDAYDFTGNDEALVYATHDGYVITYRNDISRGTHPESQAFGNYVRLVGETTSGEKFYTTYAHLWRVSKGVVDAYNCLQQKQYGCALIRTGDLLGQVDNTGFSSGPHLHYQYNGPGKLQLPDGCAGWPANKCE